MLIIKLTPTWYFPTHQHLIVTDSEEDSPFFKDLLQPLIHVAVVTTNPLNETPKHMGFLYMLKHSDAIVRVTR